MGYKEGANLGLDFMYPYQHFNRIKNNWRQSGVKAALTDAVPGMIGSDADDDRLWHRVGDSLNWDEILQATESYLAEPIFAALELDVIETATISDPPTDAELDALFGETPAEVGAGWHKFIRDIIYEHNYIVWSNGTLWFYVEGSAAL